MTTRLSKTALIEHMEAVSTRLDSMSITRTERPALFIAALCGRLESDFFDVARALANGAGMSHLYEAESNA